MIDLYNKIKRSNEKDKRLLNKNTNNLKEEYDKNNANLFNKQTELERELNNKNKECNKLIEELM